MNKRNKIVLIGAHSHLSPIETENLGLDSDEGIEKYSDKIMESANLSTNYVGQTMITIEKTIPVYNSFLPDGYGYRRVKAFFKFSHIKDGKYFYRKLNSKEQDEYLQSLGEDVDQDSSGIKWLTDQKALLSSL